MEIAALLRTINRICVAGVVVVYVSAVIWSFVAGIPQAWGLVVIPAAGFVLLSWLRDRIDAPRPYEVGASIPLLEARKQGKSFPSRHVGSGALIGSSLVFVHPLSGICVLLATVIVAVVRVVGGVHFARDVIAGYLGGAAFGFLGMFLVTLIAG